VSSDGLAGLTIAVSRGTITSILAAQRTSLFVTWPNGTTFKEFAFFNSSSIKQCSDTTTGTWKSPGREWAFAASADQKRAVITFDTPTVKGTYIIDSISPALFPDGSSYRIPHGDELFTPQLYWDENVPIGTVTADLIIHGSPFKLRGYSGRDRNWSPVSWSDVSVHWHMARGVAGPYVFIVWTFVSRIDRKTYLVMLLTEGNKAIFKTKSSVVSENYGTYGLTYGGALVGSYGDQNSGLVLDMVHKQKHWRFEAEFTQRMFQDTTSASTVYQGFTTKVTGGLIGGKTFHGVGTAQEY
jgi:hypothetical protein